MSFASLNAYDDRDCIRCGATVRAPWSRMSHVFGMHADRCTIATPEERQAFRRSGRWPKVTLCHYCKGQGVRTELAAAEDPCPACEARIARRQRA